MNNTLIFGNSGSGKSTLAKNICQTYDLAHLDLDSIAWNATSPPSRKKLEESKEELLNFINANDFWVIEGCYTDLLTLVAPYSHEVIFMNLPIETCISNAKSRPWEYHKYKSKKAQDKNLNMLINWITQYTERTDTFSITAHQNFYDNYRGKKRIVTTNRQYKP